MPNTIQNKFRFDRSISLGSVISLIVIIFTIIKAYNGIVLQIDIYNRAAIRTDIMWGKFIVENPQYLRADNTDR